MFSAIKVKKVHSIICNTNYCEIEGDIRIEANSSTIFVATSNSTSSWSIKPYPRKGTSVKSWTVTLTQHEHEHNDNVIPKCTQNHTHPAVLFSVGGFTGNFFHDFADVLFPLFSTSFQHQGRVQFLATDHKPWWTTKYNQILKKLTKHNILDIDRETSNVHCYKKIQIGLKFHKELINHPSTPSMHIFRVLIRQAYSLNRNTAMIRGKGEDGARPRLMIISRKHTRTITNEGGVSRLATKMGFEVVVAETGVSMNLSRFAETVNSCDVLVGVHGAGLTNMVFLPDDAVLVQVVPFGGVDGFARLDFGNPSAGMNIRYLEYKIGVRESSLRQEYSINHPVLRHPESYRKWDEVSSIYLNKQNVTIDLHRLKGVLAKALKLLRR